LQRNPTFKRFFLRQQWPSPFSALYIYALVKQLKTALVETSQTHLKVHNVWKNPELLAWDSVVSIKKHPWLGHKIETVSSASGCRQAC